MLLNKNSLFTELLNNFLEINRDTEAIIVSDEEGLIIAGEKRENIDMEIVSVLTTIINPILDRIRYEFDFKKFGACSFETENHRLVFISVNENIMISLVLNIMASIEEVAPYGYFLAEKTAQILSIEEEDQIQLIIPDFDYEAQQAKRLKNQLYQLSVDANGTYNFKFIIIGDHNVGKSSIIRRFAEDRFLENYRATIGLNIISHNFESFGNRINISLWDIGAQEYFRRYRKTYYNGAQAAFIVFDITNDKSFENVINWFNELIQFIDNKSLPVIIIGNKKDLTIKRKINKQDALKLTKSLNDASKTNILYLETSALTGENIEDAFRLISHNFIAKCREVAQQQRDEELLSEIRSILQNKDKLILSFITENPIWNPALQMMVGINNNSHILDFKDEEDEKYYKYSNGLILKNCIYFLKDISDSDGVFCIFDARDKENINPKWKYIISKIIEYIQKNKVLVIGIQVTEKNNWSRLIEQLRLDEELERKMGSIIFFKIGNDYHLEIHSQLKAMLNAIRNLI
ncbi:MAG: GTP-binding protein [Candidatus Hermodarchaeota archaeon]